MLSVGMNSRLLRKQIFAEHRKMFVWAPPWHFAERLYRFRGKFTDFYTTQEEDGGRANQYTTRKLHRDQTATGCSGGSGKGHRLELT